MVSQDLLVYPVAQGPQPHTRPSPMGAPMNLYFLADRICGEFFAEPQNKSEESSHKWPKTKFVPRPR